MKKLSLFLMFAAMSVFSFGADVLNKEVSGVSGTSYAEWTATGESGAEYAGQSAGGNDAIQLRSNNNNSGVVVTKTAKSGDKVSQIVVKFNSNTADARVLAIYGKDDAYAAVTDLYDSEKQGTLVAEVAMSDGAEQTITLSTQYAFIGFRSKSGALYLDEVQINWGEAAPVTPIEVESIALSKSSLELVEGKSSEKLTVTYTPSNANTGKAITWSSSDEDVATVADGVVTAVAAGKAVITATTEKGKEATCSVVVTEKPAPSGDGDIINRDFTGVEGTSYADWTGTGASGAEYAGQSAGGNESVQLRSNNNNSGVVVTKSAGKVSQITVKFNSNTADARALSIYGKDDAYAAVTDLYDSEKQGTLIAEVVMSDGAEQTITLSTQYAFIGFRSKSGALYLDEVVVNWGEVGPVTPVEVESIALSKTSLELVEGKTSEKLTVTYTPTNANTGKAITWSSSNENVATVADGVVTALAVGTATITATTENGKKATCEVTVKEKPAPSGDGDIINREFTGVEGTSYAEWTATGVSGAEYAGQSAGGNESVQLRSNNNNSGVVVTKSVGEVSQITVKFNSNTASERVLAIYGKDDAYAAPTDLYDSEKQGTLIAEVALADGAEQTINPTTQYAFIGFRSKSGALYLDEVVVNWGETPPVAPVEVESIELSKSSLELVEGKSSEKLTVIYTPTNANTGKAITWSSSDETVATVADGVVTAVAVGKAVITATTENGKEATCSVVVVEKSTPSGDGDILNREFTGVEGNTYTDWTGTGASGAEYAGQSAGGNDAIQLRSNNNNAGIVVTKSAGKVNQIVVKFNENTADARVLAIYGKNAATCYADATELYDAEKQGTLIAEVAYADGAEQTIDVAKVGEFTSVGLRSKSGALYLDEVRIIWSSTPTSVEEIEKTDLDLNAPMYNIVGQRVDASYNGIIIQKGRKFLIVR